MFDRVDEGEVRPKGGDEFGEREETVERVEALIDMFVVACFTRGLRAEDGGMELFIRGESGLGMFQVLFRDP